MNKSEINLVQLLHWIYISGMMAYRLNLDADAAIIRQSRKCMRVTNSPRNKGVMKDLIKSKSPFKAVVLMENRGVF